MTLKLLLPLVAALAALILAGCGGGEGTAAGGAPALAETGVVAVPT
ncbi:MAG TPA: hypothetical protein QGG37_07100 [Chloroflexota bacterium]|nr:hypothetical protein [Chloroflexota bacterium]